MQHHPTAEGVMALLWRAGTSEPADAALVRPLAQRFGEQALRCVADALDARRAALVQDSASLLATLVSLWKACGLSPEEIWIELHKREQLGSLLMQLNQAKSQAPRRLLKPWRVDSTKLP